MPARHASLRGHQRQSGTIAETTKRLNTVMLIASTVALAACGGGVDRATNSGTAVDTGRRTLATPNAATAVAMSTVAPLPITGKIHEVKMIGDEKGYRFEPSSLTINVGDGLKFLNVIGGPHNVAFNTVPGDSKVQLDANMPAQTGAGPSAKLGELSGPLLVAPNDTYTVSFAGVKPGVYAFNCTPHLALGMKGQVTIE